MMKHVAFAFVIGMFSAGLVQSQEVATTQPVVAESVPTVGVNGLGKVVLGGTPGSYQIVTAEGQLVMRTYEVRGLPLRNRSNLTRAMNKLLEKDGPGGITESAVLKKADGSEVIILLVTATERMQATVQQTVDSINAGNISDFLGNFPVTHFYYPKFRSAAVIADAIRGELTALGFVYVDSGLNALTIEDDPVVADWLLNVLVPAYDKPTPHIEVTVRVVELTDSNDQNRGANWEALIHGLPSSISIGFGGSTPILDRGVSGDTAFGGFDGGAFGASGGMGISSSHAGNLRLDNFAVAVEGINPQVLGAFLRYLEAKGFCEVMHEGNAVLMNNEPALVRAVTESPKEVIGKDAEGKALWSEARVIEGVEIKIDGSLAGLGAKFILEASSTSIVGYNPGTLTPVTSRSDVRAAMALFPGQTAVISGLKRTKQVEVKSYGALDLCKVFPKVTKENRTVDLKVCISAKEVVREQMPVTIPPPPKG